MTAAGFDPVAVAAALRPRVGAPQLGLVLGSGLGALADEFTDPVRLPFAEIPGFSTARVAGHAGALVSGTLEGVSCVALQGRAHLYEGYGAEAVAFPARVLVALGIRALLVTNAAGGIN